MAKVKIQIKSVVGSVLFEYEKEDNTIKETVLAAVDAKADLRYADLSSANLRYADLRYADLRSADLSSANLSYADLRYADLRYADLRSADLSSANLSYADLRSADLSSANLSYADLRSADLSSANLRYANLSSADLSSIKNDLWAILLPAKHEIAGLKHALVKGTVDGSTYHGECACLVGTIAKVAGVKYNKLPGIKPDGGRPAERWFMQIKKGDTPETNQASKLSLDWIEEFELYLNA